MKNTTNHQSIENDYINGMLDASTGPEAVDLDVKSNINPDIECKLFKVSGLNIALPLNYIRRTIKQTDITVNDVKDLRVGEIVVDDEVVEVIDLAYFIMRAIDSDASTLDENSEKVDVILLNNTKTAILIEEEVGMQAISSDKVCWRSGTSNRAWLAGTVKEHGCCLLDLVAILDYLKK